MENRRSIPFIICAPLPFLVVYLAHFLSQKGISTGFIELDMPYYSANAREIFERGNGFAYPNPYDPSAYAPVIYFHWFILLLGVGIVRFGFDPGIQFASIGIAFSFVFSYLTYKLVSHVLRREEFKNVLFLLTMWGGGILCLGGILANIVSGAPVFSDILRFDPEEGMWFLNWGRNSIYTTELVYHSIVLLSWLFTIRKKYVLGVLCSALVAATHPWTGLEALSVLLAFHSLRVFREPAQAFKPLLLTCGSLAIFLVYNVWWLNRFPEHRALQAVWSLSWNVSWGTALLAWGPIAIFALISLIVKRTSIGEADIFFLCAFLCAFSLAMHDRIVSSVQPIHFTRGYVWLPLMMLALPLLQRICCALSEHSSKLLLYPSLLVLVALGISDNAFFIFHKSNQQLTKRRVLLTDAQNAALVWLENEEIETIILSDDHTVNYLSATYSSARPWLGHGYNTPGFGKRFKSVNAYLHDFTETDWSSQISYLVLLNHEKAKLVNTHGNWHQVHVSNYFSAFRRMREGNSITSSPLAPSELILE